MPTLPGWAGGFETVFDAHFSVRERPDFFTGTCHQAVVLWAAFLTRGSVLPGRSGVRSRAMVSSISSIMTATAFCFVRTASPTAFTTPTSKRSSMLPPRNPPANSSSTQWIIQEGTIQAPSSSRFNALAEEWKWRHRKAHLSFFECLGLENLASNALSAKLGGPKNDR